MTSRITAALWLVFVSAGCGVEHYRAETVLKSDGRVDRSIWQSSLSDKHRKHWPEVRVGVYDKRLESELWEMACAMPPGTDAKGKPANPKDGYVFARGEFASVEQLPEHYGKEVKEGEPAATLRRNVERVDLILLTVHRWEETLTDIVKLEDVPVARRELVDLVVPIIIETLSKELGPEYDVSAVEGWLRDEAVTWLDELMALYLDLSMRNMLHGDSGKKAKPQAEQRLAAINRRHGLASLDEKSAVQFCEGKVKQLVKQRDGQALDDQAAAEIFRRIWSSNEAGDKSDSRFELRAKEIVQSKHGSEDAFKEKINQRFVRIVGLHNQLLLSPQQFDDRLTMPGFIVETNGVLLAENRVRWRFLAAEAFPIGYAMRCRSLEPNEANQRVAFGEVLVKTRDHCEKLALLLKAQPGWRETLQQCVTQKSKQPLLDLRRDVRHRNNLEERLQFDVLESLLLPEPKM